MARARCPECNRWAATDRQWRRWFRWCYKEGRWHPQPLWWRLDTTCLQWNDCPTQYPEGMRPVRWWIRRAFSVPASEWGDGQP